MAPASAGPGDCTIANQSHLQFNLLQFIDNVYEGVLDNSAWRELLRSLNTTLPAATSCLILDPIRADHAPHIVAEGGTEESINLYLTSMYANDPFNNLPQDNAVLSDELINFEDWRNSDFFRLCIAPPGLRYFIGLDTQLPNHNPLKIRLGRSLGQGPFNKEHKTLLEGLARHLRRAMTIRLSLGNFSYQLASSSEALERLAVGTVVINDRLDVIGANARAGEILRGHPSLSLRNSRLYCYSHALRDTLLGHIDTLKSSIAMGETNAARFLRISGRGPSHELGMAIRPLEHADMGLDATGTSHFALYFNEQHPPAAVSADALRSLFDLTPRESRLTLLLVKGHSLESAASELGMKHNTARAHLRAIFLKTGASRQSQLVATVLGSVANL